jgi:hypothetical protein
MSATLPTARAVAPGQPIREAQRRVYHPLDARAPHAPADWTTAPDRLGELQALFDSTARSAGDPVPRPGPHQHRQREHRRQPGRPGD